MKLPFSFICSIIFILINNSCKSIPQELIKLEQLCIFKISESQNEIVLDGIINSSAFKEFKKLSDKHPEIESITITNCLGSINDNINLKLANYIYKKGFTIHLHDNGTIASGGTDLFLSGHKRTIGKNIKIGVHSWADSNNRQASDFPIGHKHHKPYIDYYQSIGFSRKKAEDFYFFTIYSAPSDKIHWMTKSEIEQFGMVTQ